VADYSSGTPISTPAIQQVSSRNIEPGRTKCPDLFLAQGILLVLNWRRSPPVEAAKTGERSLSNPL